MTRNSSEAKSAIRTCVRERLKRLQIPELELAAAKASLLLQAQPVWQKSSSVLFYASLRDELDIWPLWKQGYQDGKIVALPRYSTEGNAYVACQVNALSPRLVRGAFGVWQPEDCYPVIPLNQLDLILVPGVAFDVTGRRLGRGRGFYDRLLKDVRGAKVGVGLDEQIEPAIPAEPHDVTLDYLLTPTRWLSFDPRVALK